MNETAVALVVLVCTFGGALLGLHLGARLPVNHLSGESRDTVKVAMGLIATMTALVLGLMTASAKSGFDEDDAAVRRAAVNVLMLDRALSRYGPETAEIRGAIRAQVVGRLDAVWSEGGARSAAMDGAETAAKLESLGDRIGALTPDTDARRRLQATALDLAGDAQRTRWQILEHLEDLESAIPSLFLTILVCWMTLIFASFGLLAPRNGTTIAALLLSAVSVAGAVFVILELATPFDGLIKVSSGPFRYALSQMGK